MIPAYQTSQSVVPYTYTQPASAIYATPIAQQYYEPSLSQFANMQHYPQYIYEKVERPLSRSFSVISNSSRRIPKIEKLKVPRRRSSERLSGRSESRTSNYGRRSAELLKQSSENVNLLKRIVNVKPVVSRQRQLDDWENQKKYLLLGSNYPYTWQPNAIDYRYPINSVSAISQPPVIYYSGTPQPTIISPRDSKMLKAYNKNQYSNSNTKNSYELNYNNKKKYYDTDYDNGRKFSYKNDDDSYDRVKIKTKPSNPYITHGNNKNQNNYENDNYDNQNQFYDNRNAYDSKGRSQQYDNSYTNANTYQNDKYTNKNVNNYNNDPYQNSSTNPNTSSYNTNQYDNKNKNSYNTNTNYQNHYDTNQNSSSNYQAPQNTSNNYPPTYQNTTTRTSQNQDYNAYNSNQTLPIIETKNSKKAFSLKRK